MRAFRCGTLVDSFAVVADRYLALIDTMAGPRSIGEVMAALRHELAGRRQLLVINTHGDWDHVWGNQLFVGPDARYAAPVIARRPAGERMTSPEAVDFLATMQRDSPGQFDDVEITPPTLLFDGQLRIAGGDLTLELISTPGHAPDHVAVWIPQLGLLLAGDAAELPFPHVSDAETLPELRASLQKLADLSAETVLYCHAPGVTSPELIRRNIAYFDELERRCRAVFAAGKVPDAIKEPSSLIDWRLEDTLPPGMSVEDLTAPEFYQEGHARAIQAMLQWVTSF